MCFSWFWLSTVMYLIEAILGQNSLLIIYRIFISFPMGQGNWSHFDMEHKTLTLPGQIKLFLVQSLSGEVGRHFLAQGKNGFMLLKHKKHRVRCMGLKGGTVPWPPGGLQHSLFLLSPQKSFGAVKGKIEVLSGSINTGYSSYLFSPVIWRRDPRTLSFYGLHVSTGLTENGFVSITNAWLTTNHFKL